MLAVVWKDKGAARARQAVVESVLEQKMVREIKGEARYDALEKFQSGVEWCRGEEVDRLSEIEAQVMTGRLIRKMQKLVAIDDEKQRQLEPEFKRVLTLKLTQRQSQEETEKQLTKICSDHFKRK